MKILNPLLFFLPLLFVASSCSSLITKEDCKKEMWGLGYDHGKRGIANLLEDVRKTCTSSNQNVNLEGYLTGFKKGWGDFCTPIHGFEMGKKGDNFKSFCPEDKQELFHEKFLIGKKVYEKNDQVIELEAKIKDISSIPEMSLSQKAELIDSQEDLRSLLKDIQSLEQQGKKAAHTN